ncbi:hypothetical protein LNP20_03615 [Klebsiella pneumoniae subsp. pneumoniae]|nr:hypothetical protein [Klebsiella pneumoniae subsp. pneumoniae]
MRAASDEYNWDLNYGEIAKIFQRWLHHSYAVPAKDHRCLCAKRWHC